MDAESLALSQGEVRVRFEAEWLGTLDSFLHAHPPCVNQFELVCDQMKQHLHVMEEYGVTPVLPDGKVGGNAGCMLETTDGEILVVSKSGKTANLKMESRRDFVIVKSFDKTTWKCTYYSNDKEVLPTSDTPLYFTTLTAGRALGWKEKPAYLLHGHAFATEKDAKKFGFPISTEETLCSTPDDSKALFQLLEKYPFPDDNVYIRKGHGFVLIAKNGEEAWETFSTRIKSHLSEKKNGFYFDYCNYYVG